PRFTARGVPLALHPLDEPLLAEPQTEMFGVPLPMPRVQVDERLSEGETLLLGSHRWQVWHVPGHAPGHVLLHSPDTRTVLGGDLLFRGAYGRTDLPGSDPAAMAASLVRLLELPDDTRVFPGHGPAVTLGQERGWLEALLAAPTGIQL
ncbi:MAG: MBL fold metallo-hydrolase, partial [Armatimonadetes bacterium]|nr:MBL fold metallo-hydrolase [Armatimonadota bacterium]